MVAGCVAPRQAVRDELPEEAPVELADLPVPGPEALPEPEPEPEPVKPRALLARQRAVEEAAALVGLRSLRAKTRSVPDDCSGLVRLAYRAAGGEPSGLRVERGDNAVTAMWRTAVANGAFHEGPPVPGDLVIFRETYDRNRDGKVNDGLTHVGVVESVDEEGVVTFIHRGGKGVARARLDPSRPGVRQDETGKVINDWVRYRDRTGASRLAGELFVGYVSAELWLPADPSPLSDRSRQGPYFATYPFVLSFLAVFSEDM